MFLFIYLFVCIFIYINYTHSIPPVCFALLLPSLRGELEGTGGLALEAGHGLSINNDKAKVIVIIVTVIVIVIVVIIIK